MPQLFLNEESCRSACEPLRAERAMAEFARDFPGYGWETNKGYGTPEHQRALAELGPTPLHRRSFAPVRQLSMEIVEASVIASEKKPSSAAEEAVSIAAPPRSPQ